MIFATRITFLFGSAKADRAFAVDALVGVGLIVAAVVFGMVIRDEIRWRLRRRARRTRPVRCNWEK